MNGGKDLKKNKLDWDYEEQEKFDQLYNAYSKLMYYIAFDVLKDEGLAQDAVQEAFINISKSFSKIKEKDCQELKGFIVVVIRRVAINMYNKRKRNNVVSFEELYEKGILSKHGLKEDSTFQNDFTESAEDNKVVYYIRKLPEKYADIMLFYYVYGYTADEIAKMFDMNIATEDKFMNDKEIRDYLKVYEREVEKKYDDVDLEKIQLPSGFKERTMDKIISGRNDEKTTEYKEHKSLRLFTKAAVVAVFISSVFFAATKMEANIFGFDAWKTIKTDRDSAGNVEITYDENKKTKANGADKAKKRKKDFPDYVPEIYKISEQNTDDDFSYIKWTKNKKYLFYSKNKILKDARYSGRDIDGRKVSIAGYVGYIYEEQGERTLQWNDDKYINTIGTDDDMAESELLKIAESLY